MMRKYFVIFLLTVCMTNGYAQQPWEQYLDMQTDIEDVEGIGYEPIYETLCELAEHPMDINTATREDLEQLPFLNATDIENICAYLYHYAPLHSLGELAMIEGIDFNKRHLLSYFIYIGEESKPKRPSIGHMLKYGHSDLTITGSIPFYERRGDQNGYLGYPYKHNLRYNFKYSDLLKAGIVASQDAGEPFFANKNGAGYDFYSFYVMMRNMGAVKSLVLGKYRANFGMGLVMNNDFLLGKSGAIVSLSRNQPSFRAHSSTRSSDYLQGGAITVGLANRWDLSAFVSYRAIDATLDSDDETVSTIVDAGYHRTQNEMDKKNNTQQLAAGTHLRWASGGFRAGATVVYTSFSRDLRPSTNVVYRQFYPSGNHFWNASINYGYTCSRLSFAGETATGDCGALATLNTVNVRLGDEVELSALQRFYGKKYYGMFARSFSEGGSVQDESGIYAGLTWHPSRKWNISAYSDFAYFAWPKYQAAEASRAWDNLLTIGYASGSWELSARYRLKMRQKDNEEKTQLIYKNEHRARISVAHHRNGLTLKTQCDMAYCDFKEKSMGWMATQHVRYTFPKVFDVSLSAGYFHTDDFNSRVYTYERGMLYSFTIPVFYGEGIRYACLLRADINDRLMVQARLTATNYFDRNEIGTGYQLINRSSQTDLQLQLRWKF